MSSKPGSKDCLIFFIISNQKTNTTMDTDNMRCIFSHIYAYLVDHQSLHYMTYADASFTSLLAASNFQLRVRRHERMKDENKLSCTLNCHWPEFKTEKQIVQFHFLIICKLVEHVKRNTINYAPVKIRFLFTIKFNFSEICGGCKWTLLENYR